MAAKVKLGYCDACKPVVALAVGALPSAPSHVVDGEKHVGKTVVIQAEDATRKPDEKIQTYLNRLVKKYV